MMERSELVTGRESAVSRRPSVVSNVFFGESEMAGRCRAFDWASTALGPVEGWPQSLRTAASVVVTGGFPMILVWGPELIQIYNDSYIELIGAKHPGALGVPTHECWPELEPINAPIFRRVFRGETVRVVEALYPLNRNGEVENAYFDATFAPVPLEDGTIGGSLSTLFETTDKVATRRRTAELVAVIESMPDGVIIGNADGVTLANRHALDMLGVKTIEDLRAPSPVLVASSKGRDAATGMPFAPGESPFARALRGESVVTEVLIEHRTTHQERRLRIAAGPIKLDGRIVGAVSVNTDITEKAKAMQAIESANRSKSEFLAVMSHELRTPLNAIGGYAELLELGVHGPLTAEQRTALDRIQRSQRHLVGLINEVLTHARIEAGVVRYDLSEVPISDILTTCEALVAPQMRARRLEYRCGGCGKGITVRADRDKVQQIVVNVLSNAVKFTEPGGRIGVQCSVSDTTVAVGMSDTGRGIAPQNLERVFQPFVQVDVSPESSREGVGLGLAISRDLARGMGGDLTVTSVLGKGSVFTLTLPRARDLNWTDG